LYTILRNIFNRKTGKKMKKIKKSIKYSMNNCKMPILRFVKSLKIFLRKILNAGIFFAKNLIDHRTLNTGNYMFFAAVRRS